MSQDIQDRLGPVDVVIIEFPAEVRLGDLMVTPAHRKRGICSYIMDRHVEFSESSCE